MKAISTAILLVCSLGVLKAENEIAVWKFNEIRDGGVIIDHAGKADARVIGQLTEDALQPGLEGQALLLDVGSRYVEVPADCAPGLTEDFTIRVVVRPFQVHSFRTILWKGDRKAEPQQINYLLGLRDGKVEFKYKDAGGEWIIFTVQQRVEVNEWLDICLYHNGDMAEIWINGKKQPVLRGRTGAVDFRLVENGAPLQMGVSENSTLGQDFWFYGLLDEVALYRGRLPMEERAEVAIFEDKLADYEERYDAHRKAKDKAKEEGRQRAEDAFHSFFLKESEGKNFLVRVVPATERIVKREDAVALSENASREIHLSAAGGEAESVQLVVAAKPGVDIGPVKVTAFSLTKEGGDELPPAAMQWGWIKSIETERPGIPVDYVGAIPDIIMEGEPSFRVQPGDFENVLLRYTIPPGMAPGIYKGKVAVSAGNGMVEIPVEVKVRGFTLPARGSLKVAFSFFESFYMQWYGKVSLSSEEKLKIYRFLLSYRIPPSNIYTKDAVYPDLASLKEIGAEMNFLTLAGWGDNAVDSAVIEQRVEGYRQTLSALSELGLKDYVYFYGVDEIAGHLEQSLPSAKQAHQALSANFPGIKMMQTSYPLPEIAALYNVWVPLLDFFGQPDRLKGIREKRDSGDELWWYLADTPLHPYPNVFLDYPVYDSRILGVLSWMYEVEGILYWSINREWLTNMDIKAGWPNASWRPYINHISSGERKQRNGMGNLIYPGPEGRIYPSLRLENLRDGFEDFEYLAILERLIKKREGKMENALLGEARTLLTIPSEVAKAVNDYSSNPAGLAEYREKVATMIERIMEDAR